MQSLAKALGLPLAELIEASDEPAASPQRLQMEFQLRDLARGLSDRDLAVAVAQIQALLAIK